MIWNYFPAGPMGTWVFALWLQILILKTPDQVRILPYLEEKYDLVACCPRTVSSQKGCLRFPAGDCYCCSSLSHLKYHLTDWHRSVGWWNERNWFLLAGLMKGKGGKGIRKHLDLCGWRRRIHIRNTCCLSTTKVSSGDILSTLVTPMPLFFTVLSDQGCWRGDAAYSACSC